MSDDWELAPTCAQCAPVIQKLGRTSCYSAPEDPSAPPRPGRCPSTRHAGIVDGALAELEGDGEDARMARVAARVEGLGYERALGSAAARWTRVEDTIAFAQLMRYRRIGIATCIGLLDEAARLTSILEAQGFEVSTVCCKSGGVDKCEVGIPDAEKIRPGGFEAACNPIAQAQICNRVGTELNVVLGLCVGHDALFHKHSRAPVTTLVVKDRVTGHNPVSVLYGGHYYRRLRKRLHLGETPAR
jgi:uncharacterized metal-binding protein